MEKTKPNKIVHTGTKATHDDQNVENEDLIANNKLCLVELIYKCRECMASFDMIEDLQKHIQDDHETECRSDKKCLIKIEPINDYGEMERSKSPEADKLVPERHEIVVDEFCNENRDSKPDLGLIESHKSSFLCFVCGHVDKSPEEINKHYLINHEKHEEESNISWRSKEMLELHGNETKKVTVDDNNGVIQTDSYSDVNVEATDEVDGEIGMLDDEPITSGIETSSSEEKNAAEGAPSKEKKNGDQKSADPVKKKIRYRPGPKTRNTVEKRLIDVHVLEDNNVIKWKSSTQAKNNLLNPSKGKQKRIRQTKNLDQDDEALMKAFGIIQSKVCLNRVNDSSVGDGNSEAVFLPEVDAELNTIERDRKGLKRKNSFDNRSGIDIGVEKKGEILLDEVVFDDDCNIAETESNLELIGLDDGGEESNMTGHLEVTPSKKVHATRTRKSCSQSKNVKVGLSGKSDYELLKQFGLKEMSVNVTNSPEKLNVSFSRRPGPKCKTMQGRAKMAPLPLNQKVSPAKCTKQLDEMSEEEIQEMLRKCGMGISVPIPAVANDKKSGSVKRKTSPEPSTSHGHGHLKRSRTARKSTNDSDLFDKYKLKDSKVILKNLSRIDISLLRNPNSPFGKTDWLKHKFDSDSESDPEWDIPTPPMMEEFIENTKLDAEVLKISNSSPCKRSPQKLSDVLMLEKFGISDSVVVLDSPRKKSPVKSSIFLDPIHSSNSKFCFELGEKGHFSDAELLKKFGIPDVKVVLSLNENPVQDRLVGERFSPNASGKISFADFKSALDTACKNILGQLKNSTENENFISLPDENSNTKQDSTSTVTDLRRNTRLRSRHIDEVNEKVKAVTNLNISEQSETDTKNSGRCLRESPRKSYKTDFTEELACCSSYVPVLGHLKTGMKKSKLKQLNSANTNGTSRRKSAPALTKRKRKILQQKYNTCKNARINKEKSKKQPSTQLSDILNKDSEKANLSKARHHAVKSEKSSDLPLLVKSLPVVKVKVPVLSEDEILKLTKQIKTGDKNYQSDKEIIVHDSSELIVKEILNEILESISCSEKILEGVDDNEVDANKHVNEDKNDILSYDLKNNKMTDLSKEPDCCSVEDSFKEGEYSTEEESEASAEIEKCQENMDSIDNKEYTGQVDNIFSDTEPSERDKLDPTADKDEHNNSGGSLESELSLISESSLAEENICAKEELDTQKCINIHTENATETMFEDIVPLGESIFFDENNESKLDENRCDIAENDNTPNSTSDDRNEAEMMQECLELEVESNDKDISDFVRPGEESESLFGRQILRKKVEIIDKNSDTVIGDWYDVKVPNNGELREVEKVHLGYKCSDNDQYVKFHRITSDDTIETLSEK